MAITIDARMTESFRDFLRHKIAEAQERIVGLERQIRSERETVARDRTSLEALDAPPDPQDAPATHTKQETSPAAPTPVESAPETVPEAQPPKLEGTPGRAAKAAPGTVPGKRKEPPKPTVRRGAEPPASALPEAQVETATPPTEAPSPAPTPPSGKKRSRVRASRGAPAPAGAPLERINFEPKRSVLVTSS